MLVKSQPVLTAGAVGRVRGPGKDGNSSYATNPKFERRFTLLQENLGRN